MEIRGTLELEASRRVGDVVGVGRESWMIGMMRRCTLVEAVVEQGIRLRMRRNAVI